MDGLSALRVFLRSAVVPEKLDRYLALIERPKGQRKFLDLLPHDLADKLRSDLVSLDDFSAASGLPCYVYSAQAGFGAAAP